MRHTPVTGEARMIAAESTLNSEYERKLRFTHLENGRLRLKTDAAELHVIQAKFEEVLGQHLPGRRRQRSAAQ